MTPADVGTCRWLVDELLGARIADRERLEQELAEFTADSPYVDANALANHLIRSGLVTKLQARRALDGEARKLVLGAYLLEEVIANGSLGPVYRARGRADLKPYAIKVLPKRAWNLKLARSQVKAFEQLSPNDCIVPFRDVGSAHGLHYLVWPFVEGRTLESVVREHGPLSAGETARVGLRIAEVLRICHARRLIHGLIKPTNVMIGKDGHSKLLDFGIGALLAENAEDDLLVDTVSRAEALAQMLECAAPESISDSSKWQPAGDLYSLGCTFYFALAGRYPFPGGTFVDKIVQHQREQPAPIQSLNPDVPDRLAEIIARLMQKLPVDRYRRLDELIEDLTPLASASQVIQPMPVNVETPAPRGRLSIASTHRDRGRVEPPFLDLGKAPPKRGLLGRLFGSSTEGKLHATLVAPGTLRPGQQVVLHVYIHRASDETSLADSARRQSSTVRIVGRVHSRSDVPAGARLGLHLAVDGATIPEATQEFDRDPSAAVYRFLVVIPADCVARSLSGRLTVGRDGTQIGQADFQLLIGS